MYGWLLLLGLANAQGLSAQMEGRGLHIGTGYTTGGYIGVAMERRLGPDYFTWAWCVGFMGGGVWARRYLDVWSTPKLTPFLEAGIGLRVGVYGVGFWHASAGLLWWPEGHRVGLQAYAGSSRMAEWGSTLTNGQWYSWVPQAGLGLVIRRPTGP